MMRALAAWIALLVLLGASACARRASTGPRAPTPATAASTALCQIDDRWTVGRVRAPRGGFELASISGGQAQATLERAASGLRVRVFVRRDGWSLHGLLDPAQGDSVRARTPLQLGPGVWASAGSDVSILDARPGAVAVGMPRVAPGADEGVTFVAPVGAWVPCAAIGLAFRFRDEDTPREERRALGLPTDPPEVVIAPGRRASIAAVPGGAGFAELAPTEHALWLHVVGEQVPYARVLLHHWNGTMIVGWVPMDALSAPDAASGAGELGVVGGIGGAGTLRVCTSSERLEISAAQGTGATEPVGTVEAGTRFVVVSESASPGGVLELRPHPADPVQIAGEGVRWTARPRTTPSCVEEIYDPAAAFARVLAAAPTYAVGVTVTASSGAAAPPVGSACTAQLQHFPSSEYACRLEVRCGDRVVYGHRPTNGAFECELIPDVPSVRGRDVETSAASGDGAMSVDSGRRSLVIDDDAEGPIGAFHLEARIDSFARVATP